MDIMCMTGHNGVALIPAKFRQVCDDLDVDFLLYRGIVGLRSLR